MPKQVEKVKEALIKEGYPERSAWAISWNQYNKGKTNVKANKAGSKKRRMAHPRRKRMSRK